MTSYSFRAQAFSRRDTEVSVDGGVLTLKRPGREPETYALADIQAGTLMVSDNPGMVGQTSYLRLTLADRRPLWINSTSPAALDGGARSFQAFVAALEAALEAEGRPDVIVRGSPTMAWLGVAFVAVLALLALAMLGVMAAAILHGHAADAAAPGLFLVMLLIVMPVGWRQWRANRRRP